MSEEKKQIRTTLTQALALAISRHRHELDPYDVAVCVAGVILAEDVHRSFDADAVKIFDAALQVLRAP